MCTSWHPLLCPCQTGMAKGLYFGAFPHGARLPLLLYCLVSSPLVCNPFAVGLSQLLAPLLRNTARPLPVPALDPVSDPGTGEPKRTVSLCLHLSHMGAPLVIGLCSPRPTRHISSLIYLFGQYSPSSEQHGHGGEQSPCPHRACVLVEQMSKN